ncbi:MAG TPA: PAS domain S-box protein, partial [Burkholderiaceae bacterium]|nr:PAS domain S-box protein [Burkholderiaceae bacterium]
MINLEQAVESITKDIGLDQREISQRHALLEITDADIALLVQLHAKLAPHQNALSEALTKHLLSFEPLRQRLVEPQLAQSLQAAQTIYFDLLTAGDYGADYVKSRVQVGVVQHRIGLEPKWAIGAYRKYLSDMLPILSNLALDPVTLRLTCDALLKITCLDLAFTVDTYVAEERREILVIKNYAEQIVASMPSGLMIVDAKLGVRSMNRAMRGMFGLPESDDGAVDTVDAHRPLVRPLAEMINCPELVAGVAQVLASGVDQQSLVLALPSAYGAIRHIEFSISGTLLKEQNVVLLMAQEVTGTLRSQEELHRFRMALDSSIDAVYLIDYAQLRFIDANETALTTLGYSRDELGRMGPHDLKPDDGELRRIHRRFDKIIQSDSKTGMIRTTHQRKDGSRLPVEVYLRAFQSEGRQLLVAVARDITDRLKTEADLRKSEQRFRVAFNQAAVGLAQVAPEGRWLMANQKLCEIVGYTQEEILALNYKDLTHPEDLLIDLELGRRMYS